MFVSFIPLVCRVLRIVLVLETNDFVFMFVLLVGRETYVLPQFDIFCLDFFRFISERVGLGILPVFILAALFSDFLICLESWSNFFLSDPILIIQAFLPSCSIVNL